MLRTECPLTICIQQCKLINLYLCMKCMSLFFNMLRQLPQLQIVIVQYLNVSLVLASVLLKFLGRNKGSLSPSHWACGNLYLFNFIPASLSPHFLSLEKVFFFFPYYYYLLLLFIHFLWLAYVSDLVLSKRDSTTYLSFFFSLINIRT